MTKNASVTLQIARKSEKSGYVTHTVPVESPHSRVLDALLHVRHRHDATLGFRYSCRVGMCGSCAMVINGKEGLACQTTVASLGTATIKLEPLRALPAQRDLMVDMQPFFRTLVRAEAALKPREPKRRDVPKLPPQAPHRVTIEGQNGCITCGACYSACEWSSTRPDYLGPAALNRALMLALDERDALGKKRLASVAQDQGVLRCHTLGNCEVVCPVEVPLRTGMQRLKGLLMTADL